MAVTLTIVHSNDDVVTSKHTSRSGALAAAVVAENQRHGTEDKPLSFFFDWVAEDRSQFGTGYHYVAFEEE